MKTVSLRSPGLWLGLGVFSCCALAACMFSTATTTPVAVVHAAPEQAIIVLKDGVEIEGEIIEETDEAVVIRSPFGKSTIQRSRIREIKRGENPLRDEFNERFDRASKKERIKDLIVLADWALEKGLMPEQKRALRRVVEIDPQHREARMALGHAKLDGEWVDEVRVRQLETEGYQRKGENLVKVAGVKPTSGNSDSGASAPKSSGGRTGVTRIPVPEMTEEQKRERRKRERDAEKFREKREQEYAGVDWSERHKIKTPHYQIECNSTLQVAQTYHWIMEALYAALSKNMTQKHKTTGKRLPVLIFKDYREFLTKTGIPPGVGGFYITDGSERVYTFHGTFGLTQTTYNVLAHEGTHQFQGRVLGNLRTLPNWIIEGLAVYFGDGSKIDYRKKKIRSGLIPRDRLLHLQEKIAKGTHETLDSLISIPPSQFTGSHYADGWGLVHFCFNNKKGQKLISQYWLRGGTRTVTRSDFTSLAKKYFGSMEEMEEEWLTYIKGLKPDPVGIIKNNEYISDDFNFELTRPTDQWEFYEAASEESLVGMRLPGYDDVSIELGFRNNWGNLPESRLKKHFLDAFKKDGYVEFENKDGKVFGYQSMTLSYSDPSKEDEEKAAKEKAEKGDGKDKPADKPVDKKEAEGKKKVRKRYRELILLGLDKCLSLKLSAPYDTFPEFEPSYDYVVDTFQLILRKRW